MGSNPVGFFHSLSIYQCPQTGGAALPIFQVTSGCKARGKNSPQKSFWMDKFNLTFVLLLVSPLELFRRCSAISSSAPSWSEQTKSGSCRRRSPQPTWTAFEPHFPHRMISKDVPGWKNETAADHVGLNFRSIRGWVVVQSVANAIKLICINKSVNF